MSGYVDKGHVLEHIFLFNTPPRKEVLTCRCYHDAMARGDRTEKQKTGAVGESIAEQFLKSKGYRIIMKNYRKPWGEIDIIAEKEDSVRFVEVKTVSRESYIRSHRPEELVDVRKLRKVARTAALYMESKRDKREFQLDVVGVIITDKNLRLAQCRLFEQALEGNLQ